MKNRLKLAGIIVIAIGFAIEIYLGVLVFTTPNYNLASTPKPPYWANSVPFLLLSVGILLYNLGRRKSKKNPSQNAPKV